MLLLTNSTFDGIVYDPGRVMREVLAIKPDMIFLWDEAWFAFARATPTYRAADGHGGGGPHACATSRRTTTASAGPRGRPSSTRSTRTTTPPGSSGRSCPTPTRHACASTSTQSTHKTLTSLRQGSMIHVFDQDFEQKAREPFHEAYMTHTSTSPNYQILASLDVGRRQLELEGYEFVRHRWVWR